MHLFNVLHIPRRGISINTGQLVDNTPSVFRPLLINEYNYGIIFNLTSVLGGILALLERTDNTKVQRILAVTDNSFGAETLAYVC